MYICIYIFNMYTYLSAMVGSVACTSRAKASRDRCSELRLAAAVAESTMGRWVPYNSCAMSRTWRRNNTIPVGGAQTG